MLWNSINIIPFRYFLRLWTVCIRTLWFSVNFLKKTQTMFCWIILVNRTHKNTIYSCNAHSSKSTTYMYYEVINLLWNQKSRRNFIRSKFWYFDQWLMNVLALFAVMPVCIHSNWILNWEFFLHLKFFFLFSPF